MNILGSGASAHIHTQKLQSTRKMILYDILNYNANIAQRSCEKYTNTGTHFQLLQLALWLRSFIVAFISNTFSIKKIQSKIEKSISHVIFFIITNILKNLRSIMAMVIVLENLHRRKYAEIRRNLRDTLNPFEIAETLYSILS